MNKLVCTTNITVYFKCLSATEIRVFSIQEIISEAVMSRSVWGTAVICPCCYTTPLVDVDVCTVEKEYGVDC